MTNKEILKQAIEGGLDIKKMYGYEADAKFSNEELVEIGFHFFNDLLLKPDFWKCLGKAMGWRLETGKAAVKEVMKSRYYRSHWKGEWHKFIDHLASGKDAESFFKDLKDN